MPRDWKLRIEDMLVGLGRIRDYTVDLQFSDFEGNQMVIDAVLRNFSIIGEAAG